jgi:hypothetical protein
MAFAFAALTFMLIGRRLGWALSKGFFYSAPAPLSFVGLLIWGIAVGWGMSRLIGWQHPNMTLKWVMGFALAAYVAIPNFGLFQESTIPEWDQARHAMISSLPLIAYVITEFATQSMRP